VFLLTITAVFTPREGLITAIMSILLSHRVIHIQGTPTSDKSVLVDLLNGTYGFTVEI
jgi:hypothetical protein